MTFAQLNALADHHGKTGNAFFQVAQLLPDDQARESRRIGAEHIRWAADLRALVAPGLLVDLPLEELRQGAAMAAKVLQAMERERLELCAEIVKLKSRATNGSYTR